LKKIYKIILNNFLRKKAFNYFYKDKNQYYNYLQINELYQKNKSDKLFIFGSGYSLNDVTPGEYDYINRHDSLSFNQFYKQDFINLTYYLTREVGKSKNVFQMNETLSDFQENVLRDRYKNTTFLLQDDLTATMSLEIESRFLLPKGSRVSKFKTFSRKLVQPPESMESGFVHYGGTLSDALCFSYQMNYKEIILCGVDLNDRRYFFLEKNQTRDLDTLRNSSVTQPHNTKIPIISLIKEWLPCFTSKGKMLYNLNPDSELKNDLPLYKIKI
jgi:hypothetical protein